MKKIILSLVSVLFVLIAFSQNDSIQPPYKRFPNFPPVKLLLPDSSSYFTKQDLNKKSPVMLMVFIPHCELCQHETEELIRNIDKFVEKDIQVVMATSMLFDSMMAFRERYQLVKYKNIIVAQDPNFFLPSYYSLHNLPFLAFYNKKKELISVFEGSLPMTAILEIFKD